MTSAAVSSRATWMDVTRGAAILLVVVHHSLETLKIYGHGSPDALQQVNDLFAPFRMPTLMFLSGMLLSKSLGKGAGRFFVGKLRGIAWPFLVWSTVIMWVVGDLNSYLFLRNFVFPTTVLWYLWFLLAYYALAYVLSVLRVPVLLVAAVSLVGSSFATDDFRIDRFLFLLPFFLLGHAVATHRDAVDRVLARPWVVALGGAAALTTAVLGINGVLVRFQAPFAWGVVGALAVVMALVPRLDQEGRVGRSLRYVGRNSLVFYCLHWPAMCASSLLLLDLGLDRGRYMFPASVLAGSLSGLLLTVLANRYRVVDALFRFPQRHRRNGAQARPPAPRHVAGVDEAESRAGVTATDDTARPTGTARPGGDDRAGTSASSSPASGRR